MKKLLLLSGLLFFCHVASAQFVFTENSLPEEISILDKAFLAKATDKQTTFDQVKSGSANLDFKKMSGKLGKLGFTSDVYWVKFQLKNNRNELVQYYLETAEPVTDNVDLYLSDESGKTQLQRSGDNLDFHDRSVANRKTIFDISLEPGQTKTAYLKVANDGEKNNFPLKLIKPSKLLEDTYLDQLIMGLFYGVLVVIAITYLFFYFALNEKSFLHYSLYVVFMALCQFALDGFYHQYIGTGNSWVSLKIVIISAILSCFFFGHYSVTILEIKSKNPAIFRLYDGLFTLLAGTMAGVVFVPTFLDISYPIVNILTVVGIALIFTTLIAMAVKRQTIDKFYLGGIVILFLCVAMAVAMNFGVFPENFSTDNITKPGIALEVIALSLSMANRIRLLKTKKEELQTIALQKSQEMNDVKSYFLSNMSHELRTPLNAILGLASAMENESNDEKVRENCQVIRYASHGLISSVNDILDFSSIEKGELRLENRKFKLREVFEKLKGTMQKQIKDKGLAFDFSCDVEDRVSVLGDPVRLEQMLYNLLGNACKFTTSGSIGFTISSEMEHGKITLKVVVQDTGAGIPKEKLESVFGLFSQTKIDNKRKFGGFGIGLSIVKSLVDLHGGKIKLESELDNGTKCTIKLNYEIVAELAQPTIAPTAVISIENKTKNILIVEDNAMNQMVIKMMLKTLPDVTFAIANDGSECLSMMKEATFDLVLMDLQMPVMDGYEAMAAIRSGEAGAQFVGVPIIVVTADVTAETKERVFEIGADDYLTKPVDKKALFEKIKTVFYGNSDFEKPDEVKQAV